MAAILQTTFPNAFSLKKFGILIQISLKFVPEVIDIKYVLADMMA